MYGKCNKTVRCQVDLFVNLIMCDYYVRESAQQEETLTGKGRALRKMRNADDEAQLQKLNEEQEALRERYWHHTGIRSGSSTINKAASSGPIILAYKSLRKDPKWFMRKELIEYCAGRGGCCGRGCGWCERCEPTPGRNIGVGHCITGCGCCLSFRECELTRTEKDKIRGRLMATLQCLDKVYLLTLSRAYLLKYKKVEKTEHVDSGSNRSEWREITGRE